MCLDLLVLQLLDLPVSLSSSQKRLKGSDVCGRASEDEPAGAGPEQRRARGRRVFVSFVLSFIYFNSKEQLCSVSRRSVTLTDHRTQIETLKRTVQTGKHPNASYRTSECQKCVEGTPTLLEGKIK